MDTLPLPGMNLDLERERACSLAQRPAGELAGFSKQRVQSLRQMQTPLDTQFARAKSPVTDRLGLKKKERSATLNGKVSELKAADRRSGRHLARIPSPMLFVNPKLDSRVQMPSSMTASGEKHEVKSKSPGSTLPKKDARLVRHDEKLQQNKKEFMAGSITPHVFTKRNERLLREKEVM